MARAPAALVAGPMLADVTHRSAAVWVQTDRPATVSVLGCSASTFRVQDYHYALVPVTGLTPDTTTAYEVQVDLAKGIALNRYRIDHVAHLGPAAAAGIGTLLGLDEETLNARAIEWSQTRGARSGRVAIQLVRTLAGELGKAV